MTTSSALHYEDVEIGDDIGPVVRRISTDQVHQFLTLWGERQRDSIDRFTNDEAARQEDLPSAILPGAMNVAIVSQLLTSWSPSVNVRNLDVVFRKGVPHNSPLKVIGIVTNTEVVDGDPRVECDVFIEDEEGTKLVIGTATVSLPSKASG